LKALILCAGYGKRMKPYTDNFQKSMLPLHGKPLLEYILNGISFAGFKDFIIVVGYKKEQIIDYFKDGKKWNLKIEYIEQKKLNGTGGALLETEEFIQNKYFFLSWGDILVTHRVYKEIFNIFQKEKNNFNLVANYTDDPYRGAAVYIENDYLSDILEKPSKGKSKSFFNNCGIFILSKEIFNILKDLKPSTRSEIELTQALKYMITVKNWKVRVVKMNKNEFRGDFGNKLIYEKLSKSSEWLKLLSNNMNF
jgi:NDP-sugar pyrophosphorylase family protein